MSDPTTINREATVFALELLMPEALLRDRLPKKFDLMDDVALLRAARRLRVPIAAVVMRLSWTEFDQ